MIYSASNSDAAFSDSTERQVNIHVFSIPYLMPYRFYTDEFLMIYRSFHRVHHRMNLKTAVPPRFHTDGFLMIEYRLDQFADHMIPEPTIPSDRARQAEVELGALWVGGGQGRYLRLPMVGVSK